MGDIVYHLPKASTEQRHNVKSTVYLTAKEHEAVIHIAHHIGVGISDLLRSYILHGLKLSAKELKDKTK